MRAGPGAAAALIAKGNVACPPTETLPALALKPAGRFGKSISTVPLNGALGTICTVTGSVLFCVTGCGDAKVVAGVRAMLKSGCSVSVALAVAVVRPVLSL